MAKPVSYSQYVTQRIPAAHPASSAAEAVAARPHKRRLGKATPLIMLACVLLAVACVLLIPMLVGGATPTQSRINAAAGQGNAVEYSSPSQAMQALGIAPVLPISLPEGYSLVGCRVVDARVLELEYAAGRQSLVLRVAQGKEDLSGADYEALPFTATETVGDTAVGYAGISDKKLTCAVWISGDYTYALVAADGVDAEEMKLFIQGAVA